MKRVLVTMLVCCLVVTVCACGKNKKDTNTAVNAEEKIPPMVRLKGLSTTLQVDLNTLMSPINEVDGLINDLTSMPARLNIDAASLMSMAKVTMDSGQVNIGAEFDADAMVKAEIAAVLGRLQAIVFGLKSIPENTKNLTMTAANSIAQVPVLAAAVTTSATAKSMNMFNASVKAEGELELQQLAQVQAEVTKSIQDVQSQVMGIPVMATGALAKLAAAFTGGASAG